MKGRLNSSKIYETIHRKLMLMRIKTYTLMLVCSPYARAHMYSCNYFVEVNFLNEGKMRRSNPTFIVTFLI